MDRDAAASTTVSDASTHAVPATGRSFDRRLLVALCLAMFLAVINFAALAPFFPVVARDLGTTIPLLGQVTTATTLLSAALGLAIGPLADRWGHRRLLVGGVLAVAGNLLGTGLAPAYGVLLVLAVVGALGDAILFGLPFAVASSRLAAEARRRAMGWIAVALPLGTVAGVPLLAAVGGRVGWRPVFLGAALATVGAALLVAAWVPRDVASAGAAATREPLIAAYRPLLRHRPLLALYAVSGLRAASWVGLLTYLGAFLVERRGLGPEGVALAYAAAGSGVLLGNAAAARLFRSAPLRPLVAAGTAAQAVLFGALFVAPLGPTATVALLPVAAAGGALAFVGVATLLAEETPGGAATTMVLNGSVFNLGTAVGGAAGGLLLAAGGYGALGLGLPAFALAAALIAWPPSRWGRVGARLGR